MTGLVDIHAHALPGIDDGPDDLDGSLAMARLAAGAGTVTLAATPHLRPDFPGVDVHELAERCHRLREAIACEGISLELVCGAEVSLAWALEASDEDLRLASYGQRGTDLLIETPLIETVGLAQLVYTIRARGYRVTLAHPERSSRFQADPSALEDLVRGGVLLQVNASSLRPAQRRAPLHRLAKRLCRDGLAHVIASDGHRGSGWRPVTELSAGADLAAALVGSARANWLTREAPAAILAGTALPDPPAAVRPGRVARLLRRA